MAEPDPPYVVLLGKVGCGKSSIVDKIRGESHRAANLGITVTRCSDPVWAPGGQFVISDTPGSNSIEDILGQNVWIATAFSFRPVSKIFITVKADAGRMDSVIEGIREFSDRFIDLPNVPLGVLVTHMDKIPWPASPAGHKADFRRIIREEVEIDDVVFSKHSTTQARIIKSILKVCDAPFNLTVNHDNFLRLFRNLQKSRPRDVLSFCQAEVIEFKKKREEFNTQRNGFERRKQVDLVFEFQAYMTREVTDAQRRLSDRFGFTFEGEAGENEAAHCSNMSNQMLSELRNIRKETMAYQNEQDVSIIRKCPHCGEVWTKVEGCEGPTICGQRPSDGNDLRDTSYAVLANFSFRWDAATQKLAISEAGSKSAKKVNASDEGVGCGNRITWSEMMTVQVPTDFTSTVMAAATTDIGILPPAASNFTDRLGNMLSSRLGQMTLDPKP